MRISRSLLLAATLTFAVALAAQQSGPPINVNRPPGPLRVATGVMAAQCIKQVQPEYPSDIATQGYVLLQAIIGTDGRVEHLSVISGPPSLQKLAMDAVQQWEYKPYLLNGEPVEVETAVLVTFKR